MWWRTGKAVSEDKNAKIIIARYVANGIIKMQFKIVARLQAWEQCFTLKQKKIGLILFTAAGILYLLMLMGKSIFVVLPDSKVIDIEDNKPPFLPPAIKSLDTVKY